VYYLHHATIPYPLLTLHYTCTQNTILKFLESTGIPTTYTNSPTVGWTRQLSPLVALSRQAGPQFSSRGGGLGAYANTSLAYEYKFADRVIRASAAYIHSQGFVIGQAGPTTADTFSSTIAFEPSRSLQLSGGTTYSKFSSSSATTISGSATTGTTSTTTQGVTAGASYRVSRWLTARTRYSFYHQE